MHPTVKQNQNLIGWTEDQVIIFPSGLPGFEVSRNFIIVSHPDHDPFHWMACVDEGSKVRFPIINPLLFRPDYQPKINKIELGRLNIKDPKDLCMYVLVSLKKPISDSTVNLMGPLFINIRDRLGKQIIIENDAYSTCEKIIS